MRTHLRWVCPYCGTEQILTVDLSLPVRPEARYCDIEKGGCDRMVVLEPRITSSVVVHTVGEQDK